MQERNLGNWTRLTSPARAAGPTCEVLRLAARALFALMAQPAFLLAETAVVGRLGLVPLAGLGIATAVLTTAAGAFVFRADGTTASVARRAGSGNVRAALGLGVDGRWLAAALGVVSGAALLALATSGRPGGGGPLVASCSPVGSRWGGALAARPGWSSAPVEWVDGRREGPGTQLGCPGLRVGCCCQPATTSRVTVAATSGCRRTLTA